MAIDIKKTKIRLTRGKNSVISNTYTANPAGHPIYDLDKKYLYIGDGTTHIRNLKPITTNRLEDTNYNIYSDSSNTYINSNKEIKVNLNSSNIFTVTANGLTFNGTKTVTATTFKGDLVGNVTGNVTGNAATATLATTATNVGTLTQNNTSNTNSVSFTIGNKSYSTTVDNVTTSANSTYATYYKTLNSTLTSANAENATINPFTYYKVTGSTYYIKLTLNSSGGTDVMDEYLFEFTTSVGQPLTLVFTDTSISYANDWTSSDFEQGKTYLLYILNKKVFVSSL